jgi:SAM-dependent methyltransferase
MANNTERFSDRVADYIKYRPGYPAEVLAFLQDKISFNPDYTIADIGSGTGISSLMFLSNGNTVFGVEPNKEMREAAEKLLADQTRYKSIDGTSEATTVPDQSIDLIVAAQAFHWFNRQAFKSECKRIGKPGAHCLLMWNERNVKSDFEKAYEDLLIRFGNDYLVVDHRNIREQDLKEFFAPANMYTDTLYNEQLFDFEGVKGRLLSSSYAPNGGEPKYEPMIAYLREIFDRYQQDGHIRVSYDCNLFVGKIA